MAIASVNAPSVLGLLFHRQERKFFNRVVNQLGQLKITMQWVIALWLWFESIGHHDFISHVSASTDYVVLRFLYEANACLRRLHIFSDISLSGPDEEELPFTNTLVADPIGLRFFDYHHDVVVEGVVYFFKNVVQIIFNDIIMAAAAWKTDHPATRWVVSSGLDIWKPLHNKGMLHVPSPSLLAQPLLNPMARPWSPWTDQSPEEQRSMFITFSRSYPLTRDEIKDFFNKRFKQPCVEMVMIERAPTGEAPMYGRVVFKSASVIALVLNGQRMAKFMIDGRHLWARMYLPRRLASNSKMAPAL
ncbi:hypothetical protein KSP39_PZI000926 [Platanthera zijinensis]|uniref:RRM domain-containing protein n=1 Tax=Platanthera zijinensis TaxID=2320716 RepID=A0AAP0C1R8_9ASPA